MNKIKLIIHKNAPFRSCHIGNWIKYNLADIVYTQGIDDRLIWINGVNNILLWEADEKYTSTGICIDDVKCNHKIMMNLVLPNTFPSFYWSRDENKLMKLIEDNKYLSYHERKYNTVFLGSIQNNYQGGFRTTYDWGKYIDVHHLNQGGHSKHKYSQEEYYSKLSESKFGLCLRGGGPKSWREIEYLALGTVLIATKDVDMDNYHNPLIENVHYIRITDPEEIKEKISEISEEKWTEMSKACMDWYNKNCRFDAAIKILEEIVLKIETIKFEKGRGLYE